jgi:fatty-acyl-CoA synthase
MFDRHFKVWPRHVSRHLTLPETSLYYNLEVSARRYPEREAIIYYGRSLTYRQLKAEVDALAGYLEQDLGVAKGDRVLLYMQNSVQFVIGFYAILRANAVVVPVNPMNLADELVHYVEDTGAKVILAAQELAEHAQPLLAPGKLEHAVVACYADYLPEQTDLPVPPVAAQPRRPVDFAGAVAWADALAAGRTPGPHTVGLDDLCVLPYSSGTTGAPKGCMHPHRSAMATLIGSVIWNPSTVDSVHLVTLPLFHVTGMQASMNGPIFAGSTMVMMTRWDRRVAAELIQRYRVTNWRSIVTMAIDFVADPDIGQYDLSSLRAVGGGGAAMPEAIEQRLFDLTGLHYLEGYGLSETLAATHINPPDAPRAQCLGIPVFDVDARVLGVGADEELPPREVGEIVVNAPQVFLGYWNNPEGTAEAFIEKDGKRFFRTGDLGYYDEDGYFYLVDRVKRMINASGFKVWPSEVESLMYKHPAIREVCIIAVPDERRGETVKAVIVQAEEYRDRVSAEDIIAWCREHMAAYKVPRLVSFVEELPKSGTGKLQWRQLQEQERARARGA